MAVGHVIAGQVGDARQQTVLLLFERLESRPLAPERRWLTTTRRQCIVFARQRPSLAVQRQPAFERNMRLWRGPSPSQPLADTVGIGAHQPFAQHSGLLIWPGDR